MPWRFAFATFGILLVPTGFGATVDADNAREVAQRCDKMWQSFAAAGDERGMRSVGENPDCVKAHALLAAQKKREREPAPDNKPGDQGGAGE